MATFGPLTLMTTIKTVTVSLLAICAASLSSQSSQSGLIQLPVPSVASARGVFTISGRETSAEISNGESTSLHIISSAGSRAVDLTEMFSSVFEGKIYQDKVVILTGSFGGDAARVVIVDIVSGKVIDKFFCYSPSISPDGQYVVFVKFFPTHGISSAEDHYALYDTSKSPSRNRPANGRTDAATVGYVFFPRNIGNRAGDNVDITGPLLHHMAGERFFWDSRGEWCVFSDRAGEHWSVITLHLKEEKMNVVSRPVQENEICGSAKPCSERLLDVQFTNQGIANLTFRDFSGRSTKSTTIALSLSPEIKAQRKH